MSHTYIHMGSFCRPHGISGEIVLDWYGVSPFSRKIPFYIQDDAEEPIPIQIEQVRKQNGRLLLRISGIASRDDAALLRGKKLVTPRSALPPPNAGEAYISDLINADVLLTNGKYLGRFSHVVGTTGNIWAIISEDNKEILFPAQPDFIQSLDVTRKCIVIDPPEGLLDLYLS